LEAAVEVIERHGVGELKLRDLARRVGVSHGAPANHFKDRQALLSALALDGFRQLRATLEAVLREQHDSPLDALRACGVAYVRFAADNRAHFEVMFQRELLADPELLAAAGGCFELLMGVVGDVQGRTVQPATDQPLSALGAWSIVHGLATLHVQGLLPEAMCNDTMALAEQVLLAMQRTAIGLGNAR
jgi:AcrR family transcriptional regulator